MSSIETQEVFRKESVINAPVESQFSGSLDFILITDHQTSKHKSRENLENSEKNEQSCCESLAANIFRKKILNKRLPITEWLPKYTKDEAIGDLIAGITVGLTVIPQGLAYSGVAGLPTQVIITEKRVKYCR